MPLPDQVAGKADPLSFVVEERAILSIATGITKSARPIPPRLFVPILPEELLVVARVEATSPVVAAIFAVIAPPVKFELRLVVVQIVQGTESVVVAHQVPVGLGERAPPRPDMHPVATSYNPLDRGQKICVASDDDELAPSPLMIVFDRMLSDVGYHRCVDLLLFSGNRTSIKLFDVDVMRFHSCPETFGRGDGAIHCSAGCEGVG